MKMNISVLKTSLSVSHAAIISIQLYLTDLKKDDFYGEVTTYKQ